MKNILKSESFDTPILKPVFHTVFLISQKKIFYIWNLHKISVSKRSKRSKRYLKVQEVLEGPRYPRGT